MVLDKVSRFTLALALFASLGARASVQIDPVGKNLRYRLGVDAVTLDREVLDGKPFIRIGLKGVPGYEGILAEEGKPEIPVLRFYVDGDGAIRVTPDAADPQLYDDARGPKIRPVLASAAKQPGLRKIFVQDQAAYASDALFPDKPFTIETVGTIKGRLRRLVTLHPIRYAAASNRFETVRRFEVTVAQSPAPRRSGVETIAVVVGAKFDRSPALEKYLDFKKEQGYRIVKIAYKREATVAEVRTSLQKVYSDAANDLVAAVLVGDNADVPGYKTSLLSGVTDHYYRCLDKADYASDIGTPDIAVGRFAVSTESELENVVTKLIRYEKGAFADRSWLERISLIGTDDSSHFDIAEKSFDHLTGKYTEPQGFKGSFPVASQPGGDLLYAIRHKAKSSDVLSRMKEGRGFINYGGHGSDDSWAGPAVSQSDVKSITHAEATPFVMSNACLTGKFTVDSFAETWLRHKYGAVAYLGSMDSTYWDEDDILQRRIYDVLYGNGETHVSKFTDAGLAEVWRYYGGSGRSKYYWETYVVFGDPLTNVRLYAE